MVTQRESTSQRRYSKSFPPVCHKVKDSQCTGIPQSHEHSTRRTVLERGQHTTAPETLQSANQEHRTVRSPLPNAAVLNSRLLQWGWSPTQSQSHNPHSEAHSTARSHCTGRQSHRTQCRGRPRHGPLSPGAVRGSRMMCHFTRRPPVMTGPLRRRLP